MDDKFVSNAVLEVDKDSEWTLIGLPDTYHSDKKPSRTSTPPLSEGRDDLCLVPHANEADKVSQLVSNPNDQQSFLGRIWSSVPSFSSAIATRLTDVRPATETLTDTEYTMASNNAEEQKPKSSRRLLHRLKTAWKSEDFVEGDKRQLQDDENVLTTVLNENGELQKKNTNLLKRLAEHERMVQSCQSELEKKKAEVQRMKSLLKLGEKSRTSPVVSQVQLQTKERDNLTSEISRLTKENAKLREGLDQITSQQLTYEANMKKLCEEKTYFEVEYTVEKSDNVRLKEEIQQLQQQLESCSVASKTETETPDDNDIAKRDVGDTAHIACLQARSKQLFENVAKLQEHAKTQSRQILWLQHQAEKTQDAEEKVRSLEDLLQGAEEERDQLQTKLDYVTPQDNESDPAEKHRGVGTWRSTPSSYDQANIVELQKRNAQLRSEKSKLENIVATMPKQDKALRRDLCDKEKTIKDLLQRNQTLRHQVESLSREKEELQSQFETLKFQVESFKSDFEDERKDRATAHSKMADMQKELVQRKNLFEQEKAAYNLQIENVNERLQTTKEVLQEKDEQLQRVTKELERHKNILADLEVVHQKHVQEASKLQNEQHTKATQVKQYAKENEKLKQQIATAKESLSVMAEEMDKDRKKAFELQVKLNKLSDKRRKASLPDPTEALEKKAAKLEELYNDSIQRVQQLETKNKELEDLAIQLRTRLQHGRSSQSQAPPVVVEPWHAPGVEHPLKGDELDDGTAGTGNFFLSASEHDCHEQQSQAINTPTQRESRYATIGQPSKPSDPHGGSMKLPLISDNGKANIVGGSRSVGSTPSTPHKAWSPTHRIKGSPTIQGSSATACGNIVSPIKVDDQPPATQSSIYSSNRSHGEDVHSAFKSAPIISDQLQSNCDDDQVLSGDIGSSPDFYAEQETKKGQEQLHDTLVVSNLPRFEFSEQSDTTITGQINVSGQDLSPSSHQTVSTYLDTTSPSEGNKQRQSKSQPSSLAPHDMKREARQDSSPAPLQVPQDDETGSATNASKVRNSREAKHIPQDEKEASELLCASVNQFENPLQKRLDDEIHRSAADIIQEVSGGFKEISQSTNHPYDPNLVCPMCMKKFRIGEIQFFKRHVNTCDGTDDEVVDNKNGDWV